MVEITRKLDPIFGGGEFTMDLPGDDPKVYTDWISAKEEGRYHELVTDAFPMLSTDQREFLMTGLSPERWNEIMGPEPSEEPEEEHTGRTCPNCGNAYDTSKEGSDDTVCSEKCHKEYLEYLTEAARTELGL